MDGPYEFILIPIPPGVDCFSKFCHRSDETYAGRSKGSRKRDGKGYSPILPVRIAPSDSASRTFQSLFTCRMELFFDTPVIVVISLHRYKLCNNECMIVTT